MKKCLNILVSGVGAPGAMGTINVLRENHDGYDVRIIGTDLNHTAAGSRFCDAFYPVPEAGKEEYLNSLTRIISTEKIDVLLPQTTSENIVLAKNKSFLLENGVSAVVPSINAKFDANDKALLVSACQRIGVPFPHVISVRKFSDLVLAARELGYPKTPVVIKPSVSNGMRGFRVLKSESLSREAFYSDKPDGTIISLNALENILGHSEFPELLVSEYLPGDEYTVDVFSGEQIQLAIPRKREAIRSGITFQASFEDNPSLIRWSLNLAREINLSYCFGFQFKADKNGVFKILECNARVQGSMAATCIAGPNIIWMACREAIGKPVHEVPKMNWRSKFVRYWGGIVTLDDDTVKKF